MPNNESWNMRPSRVLDIMRKGGVAGCVKFNLGDANLADIAGWCGMDCVWVCMEHTVHTLREIENFIRAGKAHNMDTMVRVQRGSYSDLVHPLEMDAAGILVPHVMSAKDAAQVAWQTRFHPIGRRPLDSGNADGAYCGIPLKRYLEQSNTQRFVAIQIEDPEPIEELDQIAELDGIDMLFFGPGDFSHGLGIPGEFNHPDVTSARKAVVAAAKKHGKFAGTVANKENVRALADEGFQFLNIGSDVTGLMQHFGDIADTFANLHK